MSFIKKMKGMVVITHVEDTEAQHLDELDSNPARPKKKKGKTKTSRAPPPTGQKMQDPLAELTEEARTTEKKELIYKKKPTCLDKMIFHPKLRILYVLILCLLVGLMVPYILSSYFSSLPPPDYRNNCGVNVSYRMECLPGTINMSKSICYQADCCYDEISIDPYIPKCFHTIPSQYGYFVFNSSADSDTIITPVRQSRRQEIVLYNLQQTSFTLDLLPILETTPTDGKAWPLRVLVQRKGPDVVRVKIWDPTNAQDIEDDFVEDSPSEWKMDVSVSDLGGQFNVSITRNETGEELFNTVFGPLIYSRNYMEITARLSSNHIYGMGRRGNYIFLPDSDQRPRWTLFNTDTDDDDDTMSHSSHPFYMNFDKNGSVHGVYLHNAAPMEIGIYPAPAIVFRALGGSLDFRFFAGPTPQDVTRQYTDMIGKPAMPPYWALGYHLCRATSDSREFDNAFEKMANKSLPYESDCIDSRLSFPESFKTLSMQDEERLQSLQDSGRKFWLVQYPFLEPGSSAYQAAMKSDLLLQTEDGQPINYFGKVEKNRVGYPDFINSASKDWMEGLDGISALYNKSDGILLFKNSPMNQAIPNYTLPDGISWQEACNEIQPEYCCPRYDVPFLPAGISDLNNETICSSLVHKTLKGEARPHIISHNAYGRYHHQRTYEFKNSLNAATRPVVFSQSTFPGSGALGGQFGGNYKPNFVAQQRGLTYILQMGLYGVPLTGVPVCGSTNDTEKFLRAEYCIRGHQMGAFLPFMMSHYEYRHLPRNPTDFTLGFMENVRLYIRLRYMLLPYIYDLFYEAHETGTPVARPLFYEFPDDPDSRAVQSQFMLGKALLVSPVFNKVDGSNSVKTDVHFPPGCWYDFYKGMLVSSSKDGENMVLPTLLNDINVHMRGGSIIALQGNLHEDFNTTAEFRQKPLLLMVALTCELKAYNATTPAPTITTEAPVSQQAPFVYEDDLFTASGDFYMDDGVTPLDQNPPYHNLTFEANKTSLTITRISTNDATLCGDGDPTSEESNPIGFTTVIDAIQIFGASQIKGVSVDGEPTQDFTQEEDTSTVTIRHINFDWCTNPQTVVSWELA
ncbi:lysosomal alpha-glucosidase-like [Palaemon carinicauda]|uniref:lysosomal alpha-glucosidase-like n=1 Tax=Palaemon carinicauda TaxID=392227 RepID=UPI0035B5F887